MAARFGLHKRIVLLFAIGFLLLVTIGLVAIFNMQSLNDVSAQREKSDQIIDEILNLQSYLVDIETGQRGFLLTDNEIFLDPYLVALTKIDPSLRRLASLTADDETMKAMLLELEPVAHEKIAFAKSVVELHRQGKTKESRQIISAGRGKVLMDHARNVFSKMREHELARVNTTISHAHNKADVARWTTIIGTVVSILVVFLAYWFANSDVQRRIVLERDLKQARARAVETSEMKSAFLANMSHEIRTPMNGVLGLSEMLVRTELNPEQERYVSSIHRSAVALLSLINGLLDLSKIESGKLELETTYFELNELVDQVVETVKYSAEQKSVEIKTFIRPDVPAAYNGDPLRIRQILINLLGNSIKFSEKGTISLSVAAVRIEGSRLQLQFEIRDQGIGMTQETIARLFNAFTQADQSTTRKYGGTGLGLSIVKELTRLMNGTVEVESKINEGSKFVVTLPLEPAAIARKESKARHQDEVSMQSLNVLVVEDNIINREVMGSMLKRLGHTAVFAENGLLAVEAVKNESYDLVLMDCHMPVMDGFQATREIRKLEGCRSKVPIIAVTASAIKGDIEQCLDAGMYDFVPKPTTLADLGNKIELWSPSSKTSSPNIVDPTLVHTIDSNKAQLDSLQAMIEKTRTLFETGAIKELGEQAAQIKQLSAKLGLVRLKSTAQKIEAATREGHLELVSLPVRQLNVELRLTLVHLARHGYDIVKLSRIGA